MARVRRSPRALGGTDPCRRPSPAWVLFLHVRYREKPRITKRGCRQRWGGSARVLRTSSLSTARRQPREISTASGRTGRNAARTITSSGPQAPIGRTNPSSLPAAEPLRRPSMPCVGLRLRLPASTSAQPACAATEELKRKYNLNNLQVRQLPIERVGDLNVSFDQIICTGVLHHLAEPDAGLSALRGVLNPDGGAMHLMVYAPYGRTGIYMLQEFCRRIGVQCQR